MILDNLDTDVNVEVPTSIEVGLFLRKNGYLVSTDGILLSSESSWHCALQDSEEIYIGQLETTVSHRIAKNGFLGLFGEPIEKTITKKKIHRLGILEIDGDQITIHCDTDELNTRKLIQVASLIKKGLRQFAVSVVIDSVDDEMPSYLPQLVTGGSTELLNVLLNKIVKRLRDSGRPAVITNQHDNLGTIVNEKGEKLLILMLEKRGNETFIECFLYDLLEDVFNQELAGLQEGSTNKINVDVHQVY